MADINKEKERLDVPYFEHSLSQLELAHTKILKSACEIKEKTEKISGSIGDQDFLEEVTDGTIIGRLNYLIYKFNNTAEKLDLASRELFNAID